MKSFKCEICKNNINQKGFLKEAFDIDNFFLNKNLICNKCENEYKITTFYKVLIISLRLLILLPLSLFIVLFLFFFFLGLTDKEIMHPVVLAKLLLLIFATLFVYLAVFFIITKIRKFTKTKKTKIAKQKIIYPKPPKNLSKFQIYIKNKFNKNVTDFEINMLFLCCFGWCFYTDFIVQFCWQITSVS